MEAFRRKKTGNSSKTILSRAILTLTLQVKNNKNNEIRNNKKQSIMKKLLAIIIMCVCVANVTTAQNNHHRMMMKHHFENLDSATKSNIMKAQKDFWESIVWEIEYTNGQC